MESSQQPPKSKITKFVSFQHVLRNGWYLKFSTNPDGILLVIVSKYTAQTFVRYFVSEDEAVEYINFVLSNNPGQIL